MDTRNVTNFIMVHCSAEPPGRPTTVDDIRRWHIARGFSDVGYHYVITIDGTVQEGRPIFAVGAHCKDSGRNHDSVAICLIGGLDHDGEPSADYYTAAQWKALEDLRIRLWTQFPKAVACGHNEFANKACPSFDVAAWVTSLPWTPVLDMTRTVESDSESRGTDTPPETLNINGYVYTRKTL